MAFENLTIKVVIDELNRKYFLPGIQREYVWLREPRLEKIEQLFDSILRGYPIGSFLFWQLNRDDFDNGTDNEEGKLNLSLYKFIENYDIRKPHNENIRIEQIKPHDLFVILDGQQRLSSLYIGLKGTRTLKRPYARQNTPNAFIEQQLFINLMHQPDKEDPDDNYQFVFMTEDERKKSKESEHWFKVGNILHLEMEDILEYAKKNDLDGNALGILFNLREAFCTRELISYFLERSKELDKVLNIFIRANSGGMQLSYSDILMSILTATFTSDIRHQMNECVDRLKEVGFKVMERDAVLKTCLLLTGSNPRFQLRNFNKGNIRKIENEWGEITNAIYKAVELLTEFGYSGRLSSAYILSIVAYYIFKQGEPEPEDKPEILRFVRNAQIKGYFSASLDAKLASVANILRDQNVRSFAEINKELAKNTTHPLKISNDDIQDMLNVEYGSPAVFPILQLLYPNLDFQNSTFHIDHIYPKSKFNSNNKHLPEEYYGKANFLYNLQLLDEPENRDRKRDRDPKEWMLAYCQDSSDKILRYKERNYIDPHFNLEWGEIESFDVSRSEKLKEKLKEIFEIKEPSPSNS